MSKAIIVSAYGSSEVLSYQERDISEPSANEIRIRNTAIGVNYHDVYVRSGLYKTLTLPGIPGCEASGNRTWQNFRHDRWQHYLRVRLLVDAEPALLYELHHALRRLAECVEGHVVVEIEEGFACKELVQYQPHRPHV